MKVKVDWDLCEANAVCMDVAPALFKVDDDDNFHHLVKGAEEDTSGELPADQVDKAKEAVRLCPRQALAIIE
ncbi:MAG: ferredoxin [Deltaproteobacteria bacterium]|nr:ferredoxin [Deltaproteobacteria bacterium]MBW2394110.1 ferredoxin [Deltaproteobacteria bacterium]